MSTFPGILLSCLLAGAVSSASAATLMPEDAAIGLVGEPGKQSETRTIRFTLAAGETEPALKFTPGPLLRTNPAPSRIDQAQVHVRKSERSTSGAPLYEVSVTAVPERYGTFQGEIEVFDGDKKLSPAISVTLLVRVPTTLPLTASPPNLALSLVASSMPAAGVLSDRPAVGSMPVAVAGLPAGAEIADVRISPLMSIRGYGNFDGDYGRTKLPGGFVFSADASKARPDKYTGFAEIDLVGSDRRVSVPVELLVRVSPWCVILLLLAGIVLGRGAKWMSEQGNKLLAAQQRVNDFETRIASLDADYRDLLDVEVVNLYEIVSHNRLMELDGAMVDAMTRASLLERTAMLRRLAQDKQNTDAEKKLNTIAREAPHVTNPETLKRRLDDVESVLTTEPGADAPNALIEPEPPRPRMHSNTLLLAGAMRWILELAGVVLLAFVGYEVLYLNGAPTFGANFSDYFGVLVWGLGADVTGRTIASLGRAPAR